MSRRSFVIQRLPLLAEEQLSDAQRAARQAIIDGPRKGFGGPFPPMLRNPELTDRTQRLGAYLRWDSSLPGDVREVAILTVVRWCGQPAEWASHVKAGRAEGLPDAVLRALADKSAPPGTDAQVAAHDACIEILQNQRLSDGTYARAVERLGEEGVLDLLAICGYYLFIASVLNVANPDAPADFGL